MDYTSSTQTVAWFRDRYLDGSLSIKPPYQRKPVWAAKQKNGLVETILLKLPVPEIYVQQVTSPAGETRYALVDGQQRIRTVLQFVGAETDPDEAEHNRFILDKLPAQSDWKNKSFQTLSDEDKAAFFGYRFAVRFLNTDNEDDVRDMFRRLNQFLAPLKPQELRNAIYGGPFARLAEKLADDEYWAENRIVTPAAIRRMGDIEFVSELLIGVLHGPQSGSSKTIDDYYEQYEDYDYEFPDQKRAERLFNQTLHSIQLIFPDLRKAGRWGNKTDFYTLFVAIATLLREMKLRKTSVAQMRRTLTRFGDQVDLRLSDEDAQVSQNAVLYVRAVEKGANEKPRRGVRHNLMIEILRPYFR